MAKRLNQCATELNRWNMSTFGQVPKQIQIKKKALSDMVAMDRNGSLGGEINQLRKEINDLLDSEEIMWQQKAKVQWLGLGDRNTKYFHSKASERKKKNTILGLQNEEGSWCSSKEDIASIAMSYFEKLYATSFPSSITEVNHNPYKGDQLDESRPYKRIHKGGG